LCGERGSRWEPALLVQQVRQAFVVRGVAHCDGLLGSGGSRQNVVERCGEREG